MMQNMIFVLVSLICILSLCTSFSIKSSKYSAQMKRSSLNMAVQEIFSIAELDQIVASARDKLVVIDYSTTCTFHVYAYVCIYRYR
jgi:thiol:disulfide interchange protein